MCAAAGTYEGAALNATVNLSPLTMENRLINAIQGGHLPCVPTLVLQTVRSYWK